MLSGDELKKVFDRLKAQLIKQRVQCDTVDSWMRPELEAGFNLPRLATREHRRLRDFSRTPWLRLVVDNVVQAMYVDSLYSSEGKSAGLWDIWSRNSMSARQVSNHRSMIAYGQSFAVVSKAEKYARVSLMSPRRMACEWDDPGDPFPKYALESFRDENDQQVFLLREPRFEYEVRTGRNIEGVQVVASRGTGISWVPVVRFANQLDLEGRVVGEVEPFIPSAQRINKTAYDRLLAQHFNSWKVKTVTGLDLPAKADPDTGLETDQVDVEAAEKMKIKLAQDDILVGESPETRFGVLEATSLEPFVSSWRADIEALAASSQTPAHALTGQLVNLSPEALAAARSPLTQKVYERQMNAGQSYTRVLQTAAALEGDMGLAQDERVRVSWQDMEIRSMSQAVDALGKAASMLKVPVRELWRLIPGVQSPDVEQWEAAADAELESDPLRASFARQAQDTVSEVE